MGNLRISFVVLTYNRVDALLQVLKALAPQCKSHHEVVIADDGSSAQAVAMLKNNFPAFPCPVRHVWHPDRGFTASCARNLGALSSRGDYLVFLDGDCVPNPRFVRAHEFLAQQGFFVNGSRVLLSEVLTRQVLREQVTLLKARFLTYLFWRVQGHMNKLLQLLYWPGAPGRLESQFRWKQIRSCNFAVWKDDFLAVNGFDETFEGWGHEDADLVLRLHHAGLNRKNGFLCTEVYHLWHQQNSRVREGVNYQRVLDRMATACVLAEKGVNDHPGVSDVVVTQMN
ncbi:MAG: glycosyl transferase [Burkholderiales bacterium RIFOXYC12_FULL_60_6]|nr:MAG: glycosyl transferase [Burkholderiales bacterium RIFOXYD12_FULL_59_19]OGB81975.1 MAG: glycosyl transferase [Burkholderiales bacterium RIFOXYC12_FULL_60_6]